MRRQKFLRELKEVHDAFRHYLARKDTYGKTGAGSAIEKPVAYFSAEFGFPRIDPELLRAASAFSRETIASRRATST